MKGLKAIVVLLAVALLCSGCEGNCGKQKEKKYDKVLILYQAGRNSLSEELRADINELKQGDLPAAGDNQAAFTKIRKDCRSWTRSCVSGRATC